MSIFRNLRLRLKYKKVKFYNLSLTEIQDDVEIGNNVFIGAGSVVTKNIKDNEKGFGNPTRIV